IIMDRKLSVQKLFAMYCIADAFLLTSKAEGLGLPIMEAMSVGVPVVASDTGAISELLADGRGWLIPIEYETIDPWGNSTRKFPDAKVGAEILTLHLDETVEPARRYMETRTFDTPTNQLLQAIEELQHGKK